MDELSGVDVFLRLGVAVNNFDLGMTVRSMVDLMGQGPAWVEFVATVFEGFVYGSIGGFGAYALSMMLANFSAAEGDKSAVDYLASRAAQRWDMWIYAGGIIGAGLGVIKAIAAAQ